jgi:hypothetical protein
LAGVTGEAIRDATTAAARIAKPIQFSTRKLRMKEVFDMLSGRDIVANGYITVAHFTNLQSNISVKNAHPPNSFNHLMDQAASEALANI